ncbi:MAG: nucleoside-diphosphate kinase [Fusobacteriales bacterium]|nr:nucleoside-diphosphate kinase [Fusobacteriales bacterium]
MCSDNGFLRRRCNKYSAETSPETVSGNYSLDIEYNLIHSSDSKENAERESFLFFREEEIINYGFITAKYVYPKYRIKSV